MDLSIISALLCKLLSENKSVTVPNMGCFVLEENSSELQFAGKIISPPERKILFCTSEFEDDGVLVAAYAEKMDISANEARDAVFALLKFIGEELNTSGKVTLPSLGVISMGGGDTLYFHASADCALSGSFPFEPISVMPIDKGALEEEIVEEIKEKGEEKEIEYVKENESQEVKVECTEVVKEDSIVSADSISEQSPKSKSKVIWLVLVTIMLLIILFLALVYIFREELRPTLEQFLYTQEDINILKRAGEL